MIVGVSRANQGVLRDAARSLAIYGVSCVAGLCLLVAAFKAGLFGSISILFYRELVLCCLVALAMVVLAYLSFRKLEFGSLGEAIAAGMLSLGVNLAVLVVLPVTVDRSVSVFVLSYMNAHASEALSPEEVDAGFRKIYLGHLQQIDRRLKEQTTSGNLIEKNGRYTISNQGKAFMRTADWIAWAFDTDRRLIDRKPELEEGGVAGLSKHHVQ